MKFLSDEILEDALINAMELGSNYWFYLPEEELDKVRGAIGNDGVMSLSEKIVKAVMKKGVVLDVYDIEEPDEKIGELDFSNWGGRLGLCYEEARWAIDAESYGRGDAVTSDVILQYLTLGTIVYG